MQLFQRFLRRRPTRTAPLRKRRALCQMLEERRVLADTSFPVFLQWFEGTYDTIESRMADVFLAGYGNVYTPPSGRADSGNQSVGYDVYDRFDLGSAGNPTLYGTETGLKQAVRVAHRAGLDYYLDFVINHNGFSDLGTSGFYDAGGYPGFNITLPNDVDGDFHGAFETGDLNGRLSGLIDIDHSTNYQMIRSPVTAGAANNIRAGTQSAFGRLANVPDPNNARFYADRNLQPIMVFDPQTGQGDIAIYPFNNGSPLSGDAVSENGMGYLMRNLQWLVQTIGVDGFRIDAAKHVEDFVFDFFDRAVYRSSFRNFHNGQQKHIFSFSEVFDGNWDKLDDYVRKNIDPGNPGVIGGNRDVLDFALFFALKANLDADGVGNDWRNVSDATFDLEDNFHNGSQGVMFVASHDENGAELSNVAHAYMLMHPGNALVYFNGEEFGTGRDFPKDGRGDALGGEYGEAITELVEIRNSYGRGNYIERWEEKENFAYERDRSALVLLSNRGDAGFDSRTLQTNFPGGTKLIELTDNASDPNADPFDDIPPLLEVNGDGTVNVRFLRNRAADGDFTGNGYLIYGPATPQGSLSLTNVVSTIEGGDPSPSTNGTTRLADIDVIQADSFQVQLQTVPVNLLGSIPDPEAGGDNAVIRLDGGRDINGNGNIDFTSPGSVVYGFEQFVTKHSPLWTGGDGQYRQTISTVGLTEGQHFITARAFRHREPNAGSALYSDFKKVIYVDRLAPVSAIESFSPIVAGVNENRRLRVRSTDMTADNVHVFFDLPPALTDAQVIAMVGGGSQSSQIDRDLFTKDAFGLTSGNHVATVVTFEISGRASVLRVPGFSTTTIFGAGLGDLNFDGQYSPADVNLFETVLASNGAQFNPAADLNADGLVTNADLLLLGQRLTDVGASPLTIHEYEQLLAETQGTSLGNMVWHDANRNGILDAGEPGMPGITVRLINQPGNTVATTVTGPTGRYSFSGVTSGNFAIEFVAPPGFVFSARDQGGNDALDSDATPGTGRTILFNYGASTSDMSRDAGLADALPTVDIVDVSPDPRTVPVSEITITFSEPVTGFDLGDLLLTRGGGGNLLTVAQTLTTANNISWTLGNLSGVTSRSGAYQLTLTAAGSGIVDSATGALAAGASDVFTVQGSVAGRRIFYSGSAFDGDPAAGASDDAAIAPDKSALLPGGTGSFANYTSYSRGINGLMVDLRGSAGVSASDFAFRVGNNNSTASWIDAPPPTSVSIRAGAGTGGADRVTIIWPDGAIAKTWLQVTVLATASTGLPTPDVFYFGNAIGEAGDTTSNTLVNATDEILARSNPRNILNPAPLDFLYDYNRDQLVNATDQILARSNVTNVVTALRLIAPAPASGGLLAGGALADAALVAGRADEAADVVVRRRRR